MSTRCRIGLEFKDGSIRSIYCHHDGYLDYVGKILNEYYTDKMKIEQLLDLGDISSLGTTLEHSPKDWDPKYWFTDDSSQRCVIYKDRGENCPAAISRNREDYFKEKRNYDYMYLFTKNNKWIHR